MENKWKALYRAGALAPLITLALYSSQFIILAFGDPFPVTIVDWFALFQRNKLLGLWYLNALDIVSFALLGIMYLALYVALRRVRPSWMLIAIYLALLGVAVFIVPRVLTLSVVTLSDLHAAATTEAQRTMYLTAGETLTQVTTASPQTLGYLIMAVARLVVSFVILQTRSFGKAAGYVGIVGFVAALANYITWIVAPSIAAVLMPINGLLWLSWWLMSSVGLFKLAETSFAFYHDEKCTGCGVCERVCLAEKVQMVEARPARQEAVKCHGCFSCLNFCPEESIQVKSKWYLKSYTEQNGRYHHPGITVKDIARQNIAVTS